MRNFFQTESASSILLLMAAILAILICNSPYHHFYENIFHQPSILFIINDGLVTFFFLLVGLEIKREIQSGELNSTSQILLPAIAALGGMLMPALIYTLINVDHSLYMRGWGIPIATDIAFSLGILSLLSSRVPSSLKVFLTTVAIFDDIGSIIVISLFYTHTISFFSLCAAFFVFAILILLNYLHVKRTVFYLIGGAVMWYLTWRSGIHPTISGVALAFVIPSLTLEKTIHPWVAFGILPLFAFANAGISFAAIKLEHLIHPISLGIGTGLLVGKPLGIFSSAWLMIRLRLANMPTNSNWISLFGIALLCGIGFTMSLFVGILAFSETASFYNDIVICGILSASILSGFLGYCVLRFSKN